MFKSGSIAHAVQRWMVMGMREKLEELISQIQYMGGLESRLAEHLIANDVVPVVRCKDCKFYDEQNELADIAGWTDGESYCFCEEMMVYVPRKGFCHKGESKDNE